MKITKIYNDAKDKNVAKTVLFYASNDESKTLYYEPTLENEVSKEDLVDFFLKGLVIQAVENGECVGEYSMPTTLGEEQSGGPVKPVFLHVYTINNTNYLTTVDIMENESEMSQNISQYIASDELIMDLMFKDILYIDCSNMKTESGICKDEYDTFISKPTQILKITNPGETPYIQISFAGYVPGCLSGYSECYGKTYFDITENN